MAAGDLYMPKPNGFHRCHFNQRIAKVTCLVFIIRLLKPEKHVVHKLTAYVVAFSVGMATG